MPTASGIYYFLHEGGSQMKPPLVLLHDAGGDHLSWPPELRRLPDYRVYTLDLPGHGKSSGPGRQSIGEYAGAVVDFIKAVGLSRAVFVGHAMGGAIALSLAADYPDCVSGIGLIAAGPTLPIPIKVIENAANPSTLPQAIKSLVELSIGAQGSPSIKDNYFKHLSGNRRTLLMDDLVACDRFNFTDRLERIRVPALVVCGTEDRLTPLYFSENLCRQIRGAALQTVEGSGHLVTLEHPRRIAKLIAVFIQTISYTPGM